MFVTKDNWKQNKMETKTKKKVYLIKEEIMKFIFMVK